MRWGYGNEKAPLAIQPCGVPRQRRVTAYRVAARRDVPQGLEACGWLEQADGFCHRFRCR